jgi:5-methylcytosine-specific restriction enzyme subunit McrC
VSPAPNVGLVELSEWDERFIPNAALSPRDRRLADELLRLRRMTIDELTSGLRIRSQSWVGLIRFESFDLRVVPKLADGNIRLVQMLALTGGLKAAWQSAAIRTLRPERTADLLDLLSGLLVRECERILAGGVLHDYIEREDALNVVRGRFLADRQWRTRFGQFDLLECRYDDHDSDIDENRLLAFVLGASRRLVRDVPLRRRALSLYEQFASICGEDIDPRDLRSRLVYHRLNSHYAGAHELCWLILDAMGVADLLAPGALQNRVFLIDMNLLFERFVQKLIEFSLGTSCRVQYQMKTRTVLWEVDRDRPYSSVIPDFVLVRPGGGGVAVDAKYKPTPKLDNADIYQCFLYAQAFDSPGQGSRAYLVVPSLSGAIEHSQLDVRNTQGAKKARLHRIGIPVAAAVDELLSAARGQITTGLGSILAQTA